MRLLLGKSALVLVLTLTLCSLCNPGRRWPFGSWQLTASSKREITASSDMEKAKLVTEALETRTTALGGIAAETDLAALMKRNAELRKSLHCGTSMRADEEALRAVMKRKEELEEGLRATKAKEAAVALEKVRPCPVAAFSISSPLLTRLRFVCVSFGLVRRRARTCD